MVNETNTELHEIFDQTHFSQDQIDGLVTVLLHTGVSPDYSPLNSLPPDHRTPLDDSLDMEQKIIQNRRLIEETWPSITNQLLPTDGIRTLAVAALVSDIGKGGEINAPVDIAARLYLKISRIKNNLRAQPINAALKLIYTEAINQGITTAQVDFAPLSQMEVNYLKSDDLLGLDFDPNTTTMGEVFTKLHVRLAHRIFKDLRLLNHSEIQLALLHHFDQGENPQQLEASQITKLLPMIAFVSLYDKLHAAYYRGHKSKQEALSTIRQDITENLTRNYPSQVVEYLPVYINWLGFFDTHYDHFFGHEAITTIPPQTP